MTSANRLAALGCAALVATTVAGCSSVQKVAGGGSDTITMGTANLADSLDPARSYDDGASLVMSNTYQSLLKYSPGATEPEPDAAQSCEFTGADATTYHCTLRSGLKFSNGHPLNAQAVVYSMQRIQKINDPVGPATLLSGITSVEAKDDLNVVFHLSAPDAVLPAKLASEAGAIVDPQVFPADKVLDNSKIVGSGPYKIDSIDDMADGKDISKVTLSANPNYVGDDKLQNGKFVVQYFNKPTDLKAALDKGRVDITDNSLEPATVARINADSLSGKSDYEVTEAASSDARYLVFNTRDETAGNQAVRQAVAQLVNRDALVRDVYADTEEPLYSVVPAGIAGHTTSFFDTYKDPDAEKAKNILAAAKVSLPVKLTLTWSRGGAGAAEPNELKRQLEAGGLFQVSVQEEQNENTYKAGWQSGRYQAYLVRRVADYPDAEDFVTPLVVNGGVFHNAWDDPRITHQLAPDAVKQTDRTAGGDYRQIQDDIAQGVPILPLLQSKAYYVSRAGITGVDATVDNTGVFRFWLIGRTGT